jgi:hypothetical protein
MHAATQIEQPGRIYLRRVLLLVAAAFSSNERSNAFDAFDLGGG